MSARALAELIDAHAAALAVYARQWCGTPDDAVQDAFCKLATATPWPDDPAAWLFTVTKHAAMDIGKAERRRKRREGAVARPERWFHEGAADGLDAETAVAALEGLPCEQREVIVLRLWSDLTLEQIAMACGCSVSTAFRRYEAGVAALRDRLRTEAAVR
jgi:RNA polymerase sigma factor (sigma-70 family)